jgi:hypothetical protein
MRGIWPASSDFCHPKKRINIDLLPNITLDVPIVKWVDRQNAAGAPFLSSLRRLTGSPTALVPPVRENAMTIARSTGMANNRWHFQPSFLNSRF